VTRDAALVVSMVSTGGGASANLDADARTRSCREGAVGTVW
jgi:hypothetical protein